MTSNEQPPPTPMISDVLRQMVDQRRLSGEAQSRIRAEVRSAMGSRKVIALHWFAQWLRIPRCKQTGKRDVKWVVACGMGGMLAVVAIGFIGLPISVKAPPARFKCVSVVYEDSRLASWSKRVLIVRDIKENGSYLKIVAEKTPRKD
jgi:hypothetical protein